MKPPSYYSLLLNNLMEHEEIRRNINENVIKIIELDKDYGPATKFVGLLYMHNNHRFVLTHSLTHSITHSLTHSLTHLLTYSYPHIEIQIITIGSFVMTMFITRNQLGAVTTLPSPSLLYMRTLTTTIKTWY